MKQLLLINYHYVHDPARHQYPGIHPISEAALHQQLARLQSQLTAASAEDVSAYAAGDAGGPESGFYLTFDDGLKDHISTVPSILDSRGLKAAFFVSSRPFVEGRAISVHKLHWLRSRTDPMAFEREFTARLPEEWQRKLADNASAHAAGRTNRYDPPEIARLKYGINFLLPYEIVDRVTSELMAARDIDEADFCSEFYLSVEDIRDLANAGHVIGCHGHTHRPFSRMSQDELDDELATCVDLLQPLAGPIRWLSYPWGSEWAIPEDADAVCRRNGFELAITLRREWNIGTPTSCLLNRINTNEVDTFLDDLAA